MPMIVTRQQVINHLRLDEDEAEAAADDIDLKIKAASAIVLNEIECTADDFLTST